MDPERNVINQVPITIPSVSIPNCPPGSLLVPVDLKRPIIVASKNVIPIDVSDLRSQSFGLPQTIIAGPPKSVVFVPSSPTNHRPQNIFEMQNLHSPSHLSSMSSADLLKQVLAKGPVKRTLFPEVKVENVAPKPMPTPQAAPVQPPVVVHKEIIPLDDGFEEEEVVDEGFVFLSPVKQEGTQQAPPRVKRKMARPSLLKNLDSDQQRMKRIEISVETDKMDRLHKDQVEHIIEQQVMQMTDILNKALDTYKGRNDPFVIAKEDDEPFDSIQDELERHYNQLKYIATVQTDQLRLAKLGCFINPNIHNNDLLSECEFIKTIPAHSEAPALKTLKRKHTDIVKTEKYYKYHGHLVREDELKVILHHNLRPLRMLSVKYEHPLVSTVPQIMDDPNVVWERNTQVLSIKEHVKQAYMESIEHYFHVFRPKKMTRKLRITQNALLKFIEYDPVAVSMVSRRDFYYDRQLSRQTGLIKENDLISIESLLQGIKDGTSAFRSKYFPPTCERAPFTSYETAVYWAKELLSHKMKEGWTVPTIDQFKQSLQIGKEKGMYNWYQEFNEMITEYCIQQEEEVEFFLSLIATASPNSGINQNAINSLLNFRALSQGCRPKWGSYPFRSLINFLAGTLGCPSGQKIICFLDNLLYPKTSQCITVDTHMQNFLLGIGHQTMQYYEYGLIEDFYRFMAKECNEEVPHRFQSAIWGTLAGAISFKEALQQLTSQFTFPLLPSMDIISKLEDQDLIKAVDIVKAHISNPDVNAKAILLVRKKLLDLGYLNKPFEEPSTEANTVTLSVICPVRQENRSHLMGMINFRRSYARKQGRELNQEEILEWKEANQNLEALRTSSTGTIKNSKDAMWFARDIKLFQDWLCCYDILPEERNYFDEKDPYFKSHMHFEGDKVHLKNIFDRRGSIYIELAEFIQNTITVQ